MSVCLVLRRSSCSDGLCLSTTSAGKFAVTDMNDRSSRSHVIFTTTVECCETGPDNQPHVRMGKLHLVDLAVSEQWRHPLAPPTPHCSHLLLLITCPSHLPLLITCPSSSPAPPTCPSHASLLTPAPPHHLPLPPAPPMPHCSRLPLLIACPSHLPLPCLIAHTCSSSSPAPPTCPSSLCRAQSGSPSPVPRGSSSGKQ